LLAGHAREVFSAPGRQVIHDRDVAAEGSQPFDQM
jgi:hypothetical protein